MDHGRARLPSRSELNMRQSFAFGNLALFFSSLQFSDYKKFIVDTDTAIALPDTSSADAPKAK